LEFQRLPDLMGIPHIKPHGKEEAVCAALCRAGKAYAVTEEMDALVHATPLLLRHRLSRANADNEVVAIDQAAVLGETWLTQEQFMDFCLLCGCDYCDTIRGIGAERAFELMRKHGLIEQIITALEGKRYRLPE
jgi:flap endonuclease-1